MCKDDSVGRVDIERLCLRVGRGSSSGIPHCEEDDEDEYSRGGWEGERLTVAYAHAADEGGDSLWIEDVPDHAVCFALIETALGAAGDDSARILAAMLEEAESLAYFCGSRTVRVLEEEAKDAAHWIAQQISAGRERNEKTGRTRLQDVDGRRGGGGGGGGGDSEERSDEKFRSLMKSKLGNYLFHVCPRPDASAAATT